MSLQTLKKKSRHNRRIAPISGRGNNGFSLNGGYRNIGAVGQFRMISNTTRTPYKGAIAKGNGGKGGKYYTTSNDGGGLNSGSCCTNDNEIIKKSSLNTNGMINTKYKWLHGTYPNYWVQEDDNSNRIHRDQQTYIENLTKKYGSYLFTNVQSHGKCGTTLPQKNDPPGMSANCKGGIACSYFIGTKKYIRLPYAKNFNQPAISQGQYISTGGVSKNNCLPTPLNKQPFPMKINHTTAKHSHKVQNTSTKTQSTGGGGCQINYLTWQDAQTDGALPSGWTPGTSATGNYSYLVQRSSNYPNPNVNGITPNT